jgi:branched-chain amino acid transport system ATP-binding protein
MQGESARLAGDPQVIQAYLGFGKKAEADVVAAS